MLILAMRQKDKTNLEDFGEPAVKHVSSLLFCGKDMEINTRELTFSKHWIM